MSDNAVPDEKTPERRTPSETLVACMEDFGACEPTNCLVIYLNEAGDICWSSSAPYSFTVIIGILECVKAQVLKKFMS